MTMQDPVADMLTRIRNALLRRHPEVRLPASRLLKGIAQTMQEEGYIEGFMEDGEGARRQLVISLRYDGDQPAIQHLRRMSRPSLRRYAQCGEIPRIRGGLGIVILSTNQGVMSSRKAREKGIGGECLCSLF